MIPAAVPAAPRRRTVPVLLTLLVVGFVLSTVLPSVVAAVAQPATQSSAPETTARYVGVELCSSCHGGPESGNQVARWTASKHARSSLAPATGATEMIDEAAQGMVDAGHGRTIAREARRLGTETDCLGCHAPSPGADRQQDTFHPENGVQCEVCHGPGSHHVAARQEGRNDQALLARPELTSCRRRCHRIKESHAVLERPAFDPARAWKEISHPLPGS